MDRNQATIKAAIISIDDSIAMRVEKSIAYLEVVQTVIRLRSLDKSPNELADAGINCILLDLDTFDEDRVETYALSVNSIFSDTGTMMICLFSKSFDKIEEWDNRSIKSRQMRLFTAHIAMEDIPEKDVIQAIDNVTSVLFIKRAKDTLGRITNLVPSSEDGNLSAIQIDLSSAISDALQAIEIRDRPARPVPIIVPGMTVEKIESLINTTIQQSQQSLGLTAKVNIGVLVVGASVVVISLFYSMWTDSWNAVGFGALGTAGVMTSLIRNPLRSIGVSARRLVQVQIAYLAFVSQLARLNEESDRLDSLELSRRLGDEMERTLKVLEQYFGQ